MLEGLKREAEVIPIRFTIAHLDGLDGLRPAETFIDLRKKRIDEGEPHDYIRFLV
ncbi:MAG: hypothetical protein ABIU95_05695 [Burkholderiales bacterium]